MSDSPVELCCWDCELTAPVGSPGWETDEPTRVRCPKHRRKGPRALATLGELVSAHRAKRGGTP